MSVFCKTDPDNIYEYTRVVLYLEKVSTTWRLDGDAVNSKDVSSGTQEILGTCTLILRDLSAQDALRKQLTIRTIPLPPQQVDYRTVNSNKDILESNSSLHNFVKVLRAGNQVWLSTSTCGLS